MFMIYNSRKTIPDIRNYLFLAVNLILWIFPQLIWSQNLLRRTFEGSQVMHMRETVLDEEGSFQRIKIVKTNFKYPFIRIDQHLSRDQTTGIELITKNIEMVANHIIVKIRHGKTENDLQIIISRIGGNIRKKMHTPNLYLVETNGYSIDSVTKAIDEYKGETDIIEYAEPDYIVHILVNHPNDPLYNSGDSPPSDGEGDMWGLNNVGQTGGTYGADIDAPEAWDIATGNHNIVVGVIDTGVDYTHPDLEANIWINQEELKINNGNYPEGLVDSNGSQRIEAAELLAFISDYNQDGSVNFKDVISGTSPFLNNQDEDNNGFNDDLLGWNFEGDNNDTIDDNFHGTHCAGTIGAVGDNSVGVVGVNWNITIMSIKSLDELGLKQA